ncbi:hypothetical protein DPEC_G00148630 [Dallia pectoralis]|uniref:Uncharacterized protein n=1 Tax=Dallia pectoralis TaxID=75939 RepID=A0ACC2GIQ4_DALPE|nr:hypothetical protein DPEC_G00148630 [Dallia pectoralis]
MNEESQLDMEHILTVVLPGGQEKRTTVHGSKPVMDLLVTLCAQYHLNPADFTVELQSANRNDIACKPSSLIGAMEADRIILKPKGAEEKIRKPYVPEVTVRLLVNYKKNHKAVVRVSPGVPLQRLLPSICEKCEFDLGSTILLKTNSAEALDLTKSLNDYGLRELCAKEAVVVSPAVSPEAIITPTPEEAPAEEKRQKENKGLFSLFRRIQKKPHKGLSVSVPALPGLNTHMETSIGMNSLGGPTSNTLPAKKRRAPPPPMASSRSVPANLNVQPVGAWCSALTSRKKRAPPPPPCANTCNHRLEVKGNGVSLYTVEEVEEEVGEDQDLPSSASSASTSISLAHPQLPSSPASATRQPSNPCPGSLPCPPSIAEILTPSLLCQTRAKLKRPSISTPITVGFVDGAPSGASGRSLGLQEVSPLHLLQLRAKVLGETWKNSGQREGMTTFTVVPRAQTLRRLQGSGQDLDETRVSESTQTVDETSSCIPDLEWDDEQAISDWSEVEGTSPKPYTNSTGTPGTTEGSPYGTSQGSSDRVLSPCGLSCSTELHQTELNSPVEHYQAESGSPAHPEESPDSGSGVQDQEDSESLSEAPCAGERPCHPALPRLWLKPCGGHRGRLPDDRRLSRSLPLAPPPRLPYLSQTRGQNDCPVRLSANFLFGWGNE